MNEWPKSTPSQPESIPIEVTHTPLRELLPGVATEQLHEGDFDDLLAPTEENVSRANEAGILNDSTTLDTGYAGQLRHDFKRIASSNPEVFTQMRDLFQGRSLIDLAAGSKEYGYEIARILGSTAYVGVEPYNAARLSDTISYSQKKKLGNNAEELIPYTVVAEDILTFLKRLPDQMSDVSFLSSGSDRIIFPNKTYNDSVREELKRILAPGSGIIFYDSVFETGIDSKEIPMSRVAGQSHPLSYARKD